MMMKMMMLKTDAIKKVLQTSMNMMNDNKFFFGLTMLILNLGSKYLVMDISKSHEMFLKSTIIRRFTIFCMFFVATKDVYVSFVMTAAFIIFALGIFNEKSPACVLPKSLFDDHVTDEEYKLAQEILSKYDKQKQTKEDKDKDKNKNKNKNNEK